MASKATELRDQIEKITGKPANGPDGRKILNAINQILGEKRKKLPPKKK
jgi:hypothetical protein